jgi:hypothetical protein
MDTTVHGGGRNGGEDGLRNLRVGIRGKQGPRNDRLYRRILLLDRGQNRAGGSDQKRDGKGPDEKAAP